MNFRMMGVFYYCFINNVKFIISGPALPEIDMFEFSAWITDRFLSCFILFTTFLSYKI